MEIVCLQLLVIIFLKYHFINCIYILYIATHISIIVIIVLYTYIYIVRLKLLFQVNSFTFNGKLTI